MKIYKIMSFILSLAMTSVFLPSVYADTCPITKTELVNVAEFKPIASSDIHVIPEYPLSNLTDGDRGTFIMSECGAAEAATEEITIDLLKRCRIEKIEIFDRYDYDAPEGRKCIDFLAANNEDFSDAVVIGSLGIQDTFLHQGKFEINLNGNKAYRYIRLKRTGGGDYQYAELRVWAKQTMTDVARGLTEDAIITDALEDNVHWIYPQLPPKAAFDGDINTSWVEDGNAYRYLRADLGKEYPIGLIEMTARADGVDTFWSRKYINIYATNNNSIENTIFDPFSEPDDDALKAEGFTRLVQIGANNVYESECSFPAPYIPDGYDEVSYGKTGYFQATCDDSFTSQYIIFKNYKQMGAALSDFRAYVINPEPVDAYSDGSFVYLMFSDEMDFSDLSGVKMEGVEFEIENDYTLKADISELGKNSDYTISISGLCAENGTAMAKDYEITLDNLYPWTASEADLYSSDEKVDNFHNADDITVKTFVTNSSLKDISVLGIIGLYSEDGKLIKAAVSDNEIKAKEGRYINTPMSIEETPEEMYLKAFVWEKESFTPISDSKTFYNSLTSIYVSENGSDENRGTLTSPFATLSRAQAEIRANNSDMDEDINVYIRGGTYELPKTLAFDDSDSGTNGYRVNWQAFENEDVTISGGVKIDGWTEGENGIWSASVSDERIETIRELYVNGKKAQRARSENRIAPVSLYEENGEISGYYVNSEDVGVYNNPSDIQLKYARGWASVTLNVDSIEDAGDGKVLIKMKQPDFSMMTFFKSAGTTNPAEGETYHIFWLNEENKFYMENAYELLDNSGEFYFDKTSRVLYYKSRGEDMREAEIYAPRLEKLVTISGSDLKNKAENISFSGLTFAHAAYNEFDKGLLGDQAQTKILVNSPASSYAPDNIITGANISVSEASDIEFKNNVFCGLAAVGIGLYNGAENITISGNTFYDIGDSAVTVGAPSDAYISDFSDGVNVALFKPVSASCEEWGNFDAYINDGDAKRGWNLIWDGDYTDEWVQIDLEKAYSIDRVVLKQRVGELYEQDRRNFKIIASNYEDFSDGGTVILEQGEEVYAEEGDYIGYPENKSPYRYIRVMKTKNEYSYFPEIEVITKDTDVPVQEICKNNTISHNYITRAGEFNQGAPGIQAYYTESTRIINNTLYDLPYSGICFGWGWTNTPDSTTSKNNEVRNNVISDYALICYDAGGIYTLGQEPESIIDGNYIKNQTNAYAAYYPDSGSSFTTVTNNVFENIDMAYHIYSSKQSYLTVQNNWSTNPRYKDLGYECTVSAPTLFIPSDIPAEAQAIIDKAGAPQSVIEKAVPREIERTFDEMYSNVLEENNPEILSMPNIVLGPNYLMSKIEEANAAIELAGERGDAQIKAALLEKLERASEITASNRAMENADKLEMINLRLDIIELTKEYYNSID